MERTEHDGSRLVLTCDQCGTAFEEERRRRDDATGCWHSANIAGWARIARAPDRHVCAMC
jgi:hypothetical protein